MKLAFALAVAMLSGSISLLGQQGSSSVPSQQGSSGIAGSIFNVQGPAVASGQSRSFGVASMQNLAEANMQSWFPQASNCPAALRVQHLADGSIIRTGRSHPQGVGQWLHIVLSTGVASSATFVVRGYSAKGRLTQADSQPRPDATSTVNLSFRVAPDGQAQGDVWAPGLAAVASIDLIAVKYSDGTSWTATEGQACRVTPDPMMLIGGR